MSILTSIQKAAQTRAPAPSQARGTMKVGLPISSYAGKVTGSVGTPVNPQRSAPNPQYTAPIQFIQPASNIVQRTAPASVLNNPNNTLTPGGVVQGLNMGEARLGLFPNTAGESTLGLPTWGTGTAGVTGGSIAGGGGGDPLQAFIDSQAEAARQAAEAAKRAEADRVARMRAGFNTQHDVLNSSFGARGEQLGKDYNQGILGFLDNLRAGQLTIDNSGVQNELSRRQGYTGILDMVGQGINSGRIMLANKNAGNSSASDALARAYASMGTRQNANNVGQYIQGENSIAQAQNAFDIQGASGLRTLTANKERDVTTLVSDAQSALASLDAAMVNANIPDRIDIQTEKERIKQDTLAKLAQYDSSLTTSREAIKPSSSDTRRAEGRRLADAGRAPNNPFDFLDIPNSQFESNLTDNGLPLFQFPRPRKQLA